MSVCVMGASVIMLFIVIFSDTNTNICGIITTQKTLGSGVTGRIPFSFGFIFYCFDEYTAIVASGV